MTQYVKKLPAVFQTVTEKKFFDATFDQVLSKKDSDYLAGYLGRRDPGKYNPISDFYIPEPSKNRTWWQLEPTSFSRTEDGTRSNIFFYEDLLDNIEYYGGNTLNQDRLFNSEYYSFGPPIDYDMFINYHDYYWIDQRLPVITITGVLSTDIIGKESYTTPPTATPPNLAITSGMSVILADDPNYLTPHTVENFGGCEGLQLVPYFTDITSGATFEFLPWDGSITLSNGRTVTNNRWDANAWDTQYRPSTGDYITIQRGSVNRNAWSRTNKWFHIDTIKAVISITGGEFPQTATRALRPIIQFNANVELYNSGTRFNSEIEYGFRDYSTNGNPIRLVEFQDQNLNFLNITYSMNLSNGDLVCFFNDDTEIDINVFPWDTFDFDSNLWDEVDFQARVNKFIFRAEVDINGIVSFAPYTSWYTPVSDGDIVIVTEDGPGNSAQAGETWYHTGDEWEKAFNDKSRLNQPPLFQLYDHEGIKLNDLVKYPDNNFQGNKIFSYKVNPAPGATSDPVLGFPIVYSGFGQSSDIVFDNNLITDRYSYNSQLIPIDGYYYYKEVGDPVLGNSWNLYDPCECDDVEETPVNCVKQSKQRVIDKYVVGFGTLYQFKLSVTPFGYPTNSDIIVSVNGIEVKNSLEQVNGYTISEINNSIYVDLNSYLSVLLSVPQSIDPVVEIQTYTHGLLNPSEPGYSSIPQQLEANPNQEEVSEITGSDLTDHFVSIIGGQAGFEGSAFGGPNNYRDTRKNQSIGQKILQNTTPLLKTMLVSAKGDLSFIEGVRFSSDEYNKFKNRYMKIAQQLINTGFNPVQYQNKTVIVSFWVEEILKQISVSKEFSNAFAYSYMIANGSPFATQTFSAPVSANITLSGYVDLSDSRNALYIYEVENNGKETLLLIDRDYRIISDSPIEIEFINSVSPTSTIYTALYKDALPAYIPSTPSKLGTYPVYEPRMEWDSTYVDPTWVIIGHDGSKTIAYGSPTVVDYRDQLLLELEKRIYNLIKARFRKEYYLPVRLETVKPGFFREGRYTRQEYLDITVSYINKWSAKNRANYRANDWVSASASAPADKLWKLYNYRNAVDYSGNPLNLPGNWKGIYQYLYDTYNPDTRPWEMLGFSIEPGWWRFEYGNPVINAEGQEVWGSSSAGAHNMYSDLEAGIIRQGPSAEYDPETLLPVPQKLWARPGLSNYLPVDPAGELVPVLDIYNTSNSLFEITYSGNPYDPFGDFDADWAYGDGAPVEQAWMLSSTYSFSVQEFLFLMVPAAYGEYMWDTFGTQLSTGYITVPDSTDPVRSSKNWQFVQNAEYNFDDDFFKWMRPKNRDQVVHAETTDGIIQLRYGYQRWISDRILFLGKSVNSTFGQKVRALDVNLANKLAGFTNKDTTNTYIESVSVDSTSNSLIIPSNNFDVLLHKSPSVETYTYSGVIVRALGDGTFIVYGYDLLSSSFTILERSNAKLIEIEVGGTPADFVQYANGAAYNAGDIVRYNGVYYQSNATQTLQKFSDGSWSRLKTLPTVGGISVSYKPVSNPNTISVPYGSVLKSVQEVFDFLIGWGAYLESRGWKFDEVNQDTNQISDWLYAGKQFLFWLNSDWAQDASIQLSPLANKATLEVSRGYPDDVESISNGIYSILDKFGTSIPAKGTATDRDGRLISVSPVDLSVGGIYFLQINVSETEHILIFDNKTNFNDTVYSPLLRVRQQRLRFNGFRSNGWYGKMEAPGYLVIDNQLAPNFDTIVDAMRYYYDPDVVIDNPGLEDLGRHLIGYESKSYLDNLQVSNDVQYLFYQGAIRQKGTIQALDKLFRSTNIQTEENIEIYEEWALKVGDFGNTVEQVSTEISVIPEQNTGEVIVARLNYRPSHIGFVKQINVLNAQILYTSIPTIQISAPDVNPSDPALTEIPRQAKAFAVLDNKGLITRIDINDPGYGYLSAPTITIVSPQNTLQIDKAYSVWQGEIVRDQESNNIIEIDIDDTNLWKVRPVDPEYSLEFPLTSVIEYPIPNAGYVNFNDVDFSSFDVEQTVINWGTPVLNPGFDDTVWVAKTFTEDWDVYKMVLTASNGGIVVVSETFDVIADTENLLWLRTSDDFLITPQFVTTGEANTDLGNLMVLQVAEKPAIIELDISGIQAEASTDINLGAIATAIINSSGEVIGATVDVTGSGYTSAPSISIDPPVKTQAIASASISDGQINSITISNNGKGYVSPIITISPPEVSTALAESLLNGAGNVITISVVSGGAGYYGSPPQVFVEPPPSGTPATATANILNGRVVSISVVNQGSGYLLPPKVFINPPVATQATASASVLNTEIISINIIDPGAGYSDAPVVNISFPDGQTSTASTTISGDSVLNININTPGSGYSSIPKIGIQPPLNSGEIISVSVDTPGFYPNNKIPVIEIIGDGVGATAEAVMVNGTVSSVIVTNSGTGYTFANIIIQQPDFPGNGEIINARIISGGSGYVSAPNIFVIGANTIPAVLEAEIANGSVSKITIVDSGSGYLNPTVNIGDPTDFTPSSNFAVGFEFDRTEGGFNYYRLQTLIGTQIEASDIDNYENFNKLLLFKSMRFWEQPSFGSVDYLDLGDKIWVDGVNLPTPKWSVYKVENTDYSLYRQEEKLINTKLFESASIFDTRSRNMLSLLPVYDPFKNILPGPAIQNITYMSLKDPARYNVTTDAALFSENINFAERQVGQLWWDQSSTRYVYYEQPRWLNQDGTVGEDATSNLEYRRNYWGNLFPSSTVDIYEWTKSPVPPAQYTGTGTPRSTDTYVQIVTINKFTNIEETNYYFWVLNPTDKPNLPNRTVAASDVSRMLQSPKSQGFMFFAPIQQTDHSNSYMFYNVQEILAYRGNNVQIQYRLSNRDDQPHTQWAFFREGDTASVVTNQFWNKMVDSICGYTKPFPISHEYDNGIIIDGQEILPVPDPALTNSEKFGIEYRPRQSMFVNLAAARKVFVQAANNLLKYIPIRDDNPTWNAEVSTSEYWTYTNWYRLGFENAQPNVSFQTLADATSAMNAGQLQIGDIVFVVEGTVDNRYVLYVVTQLNPNIPALSLEEVGIENSAIKLLDTVYTTSNRYTLSVELRQLLNAFRTEVMIDENIVDQNKLFFSMINYVLSEQKTPDWVFKSSYIYVKENNVALSQGQLYLPNQIENVVQYINDAKPYHTQIRDYTGRYTVSDISDGTASDFGEIIVRTIDPDNINWDTTGWDTSEWDMLSTIVQNIPLG